MKLISKQDTQFSKLLVDEPLSKYTYWKIGGKAKKYYKPKNLDDLSDFIKSLPVTENILFFGGGTNILIRDGGFNGTIIHICKVLDDIKIINFDACLKNENTECSENSKNSEFSECLSSIGNNNEFLNKNTVNNFYKANKNNKADEMKENIVIKNQKNSTNIKNIENNFLELEIGGGASCYKISKFCENNNLIGAEFLRGIPGLLGGALVMNAGAFGYETWDYVTKLKLINRKGEIIERDASDFDVGYRYAKNKKSKEEWFVGAILKFQKAKNKEEFVLSINKVKALLEKRNNTQPIGELTCGSVFRNPEGFYAAKLIENSGLKGKKIGGAVVSTKHANFIVNTGKAKASDVEGLIDFIVDKVFKDHNVRLNKELHIFGEKIMP